MTEIGYPRVIQGAGVALWRQIADSIRAEIAERELEPGAQLEGEQALAARYGVNRHTVRVAIRALQEEGVLRAEHGRGTFVASEKPLSYRLGSRTRLRESMSGQVGVLTGELLTQTVHRGEPQVLAALELPAGSSILIIEALSRLDGRPLSRSTHYLDPVRFRGLARDFGKLGSFTAAFARHGVADYTRRTTTVSGRHADPSEADSLELAPGAIVLVSRGLDVDADGRPVQLVVSRFAASRIELTVGDD